MADKRRFDLFAEYLTSRFPDARRIYDVAGGMGKLNQALTARGRLCTTFDRRQKHFDVPFVERIFTLEEPCETDLVVGMHSDGATRVIVEYAGRHRVPFAIVPCCSDNSMPYKPWMRHLSELAQSLRMGTEEHLLPMEGRARVITGIPLTCPLSNLAK